MLPFLEAMMTKQEFIDYLKNVLIPDLHASGNNSTAADFYAAMLFLEGANEVQIRDDDGYAVVIH
jgi:hypothetical protein